MTIEVNVQVALPSRRGLQANCPKVKISPPKVLVVVLYIYNYTGKFPLYNAFLTQGKLNKIKLHTKHIARKSVRLWY
jgi:hypothetical protein